MSSHFALSVQEKKGRTKKETERYEWKEEKEHRKVRATRSKALFPPHPPEKTKTKRKGKERKGKERKGKIQKFENRRLQATLYNLSPHGKKFKGLLGGGENGETSPPRPLAISMDRG